MGTLHDIATIARSGIMSHQERLNVIAHNIANVDTEGYHRRQVQLETVPPTDPMRWEIRPYSNGAGVTVADVARYYNHMTETQLLDQQSGAQYHLQKSSALSNIEALMVGTGEGSVSEQFHQFWSSWQDLANNADSMAFRSLVMERGVGIADHLQALHSRLSDYRSSIAAGAGPAYSGVVSLEVGTVNRIASEIQHLNTQVADHEHHFDAHDLIDRRGQLIRQLSENVDITVASDFTITIDGEVLVNSDGTVRNDLTITAATGPITFSLDGSAVTVTEGQLGAWVDVAATADSLVLGLDTLATELIGAVNAVHNSDTSTTGNAYDLDGNRSDWDFFTGTGADDIAVNTVIHDPVNPLNDDPRKIAAAATVHSVGPPVVANPGDGAKALEIAGISEESIAALDGYSLTSYLDSRLGALGAVIESEENMAMDGDSVVSMLRDSIESETGVNLDEEMVEMMSAQRAYEAAMRVFMMADDMMDLIINGLGV